MIPFKEKRRGEMLSYARPSIASYEDQSGDIVFSNPNTPRYEYKDGYPYGLKMGDGDSASIPLTTNELWPVDGEGTIVCTFNAPVDNTFVVCGDVVLKGYGAMKTVIVPIDPTTDLSPRVSVAPNADTFSEDESHLLIFKYYEDSIDFSSYVEHEAMEELNLFVHDAWN